MLAHHLLCRVAKQSLRTTVPAGQITGHVQRHDGRLQLLDDAPGVAPEFVSHGAAPLASRVMPSIH